jgi:2-polyprenyl-6-methoxyphenol hydroxylase-like FAD-dependent oxidoreductase
MSGLRADLWDVVVAGGGVAGVSVAAALQQLGSRVLLVEPGLDNAKRLAGELIHPPGASDLAELGLLAPLETAGVAPVLGFAVSPEAAASPYLLPYGEIPGVRRLGFAIDHAVLSATLLEVAARLPRVTLWRDSRVTALDLAAPDAATVTVTRAAEVVSVRARLVVAADGGTSTLRRLASISHTRVRLSQMVGVQVPGDVPSPGYGNVFLGGPAPVLAYGIGAGAARVMFDVPGNPHGVEAVRRDPAYLGALPTEFRERVRHALEAQPVLIGANYSIAPAAVTGPRLALVGDAAGSCHPLTATGLSVCTRDALRLRQALAAAGGDIPRALAAYAGARGGPQRTRMALAEALYRAFAGQSDEMRLLRDGILRFWKRSRRGRAASMALLSTHEGRMSVMAMQYARVIAYALVGLVYLWRKDWPGSPIARLRAVFRLSLTTMRILAQALHWRPGSI